LLNNSKILFIGSFPSETKGGSSTASMLLLGTNEFRGNHIIKLDSTLDDISRNLYSSRVIRAIKRFIQLTTILIRDRPQSALIFCGHGWSFIEKGLMVFYMRLFKVKSVLAPNSGLILRTLESSIFRWYVKKVFKSAKYVICQGQYWETTFKSYVSNPNKLKIVKNWLSDSAITSPLPPFSLPTRGKIKLVYLGWLEKYKGILELIESVKQANKKGYSVSLDIWGEGSYKSEIINKIDALNLQQEVILKGWANEKDKIEIYKYQPILVLPSYYEGMPNVVLEAMANGLPVIASNISTLPEIVKHEFNGLLYNLGDEISLTGSIIRLGSDPMLRQQLRDNAKADLTDHESWRASQQLFKLLTSEITSTDLPSILIISDWFEPAYKGGGPITSCYNFCLQFNKSFNISVITSNKDFKSDLQLPVDNNTWINKEYGIKVFYASGLIPYVKQLTKFTNVKANLVYLQGVFSCRFGILPLLLKKLGVLKSQFIIAPRGMLQSGALGQKKKKKKLYLIIARMFGLYKGVQFQATDVTEKNDIRIHTKAKDSQVDVVPNFPNIFTEVDRSHLSKQKIDGAVSLVYYSRIAPKKNLEFYIDVLNHSFEGHIKLGIIGPVEDELYWKKINEKISNLPNNIDVTYYGAMPLKASLEKIQEFHFMVLPTLGENYGHVIVESFSVGVPVIISNKTPWLNLELNKLGWDFDLDITQFRNNVSHILKMNQEDYDQFSEGTTRFIKNEIVPQINELKHQYKLVLNKMFI